MHCNTCGFAVPVTARICTGCGSPIGSRPQPARAHQMAGTAPHPGPRPTFAPPAAYAPPSGGSGPRTVVHWLLPVGRSWQSVVAGYLAVLAIVVWFLGPFALGLGTWALVRSGRENVHGRGRAVFAVIVGLLSTCAMAALLMRAAS